MCNFIIVGLMLIFPNLDSRAEQPTLRCQVISGRKADVPRPTTQQIEWLLKSKVENNVQLFFTFNYKLSYTRSQNEDIPLLGPCDVLNASSLTVAIGHANGIPLFRVLPTKQLQYQMVGDLVMQHKTIAK